MVSRKVGSTLDVIGVIMLILFLAAIIFLITISSIPTPREGCGTAYCRDGEYIEAAVTEFMKRPTNLSYYHTIGEVPIVNNTVVEVNGSGVIPDEDYYVVAVCPLLTVSNPKGILKHVPVMTHSRNCLLEGANAQLGAYDCAHC